MNKISNKESKIIREFSPITCANCFKSIDLNGMNGTNVYEWINNFVVCVKCAEDGKK